MTNEERELKKILYIGDFKEYETDFFETREYKNLRNTILDYLPKKNIDFPNIKICNIKDVTRAGKMVLYKHCPNINTKVPYTLNDELLSKLFVQFGENPKSDKIDEIIEFIKENYNLTEVTDIPIYLNLSADSNGCTMYTSFYENLPLKFYKKLPYVVYSICLTGKLNDLSKGTYVHELYHALSKRNKGYTKNILHDETLSIFMEMVTALDLDEELVDTVIANRLLWFKNNILDFEKEIYNGSDLSYIIDQEYIISSLLASSLFNVYLNGNNNIKKEIDKDINYILTGHKTLEEILNKYEVNNQNGTKIMSKQIKKISKNFY